MSNVVVSIRPCDVKNVSYKNEFRAKPGEKINIQVKTNVAVKLAPDHPQNAAVLVRFEAADQATGIELIIETITALTSNTFVDDFEGLIKDEYLNTIVLAANEKIRTVATNVGLNVTTPTMNFGNKDNVVEFKQN